MIRESTANDFRDSSLGSNISIRDQIRNSFVPDLKTLVKILCENFACLLCGTDGNVVWGQHRVHSGFSEIEVV
jgi:hypothetical protein